MAFAIDTIDEQGLSNEVRVNVKEEQDNAVFAIHSKSHL